MKGRVKMFNEEKGYGFILGDDANDYFVHITEVKSVDTLTRGTIVEFQPAETERGKVAKGVSVSESVVKRPAFVELGNTRIKLSNIKNYGISSVPVYYGVVVKKVEHDHMYQGLFGWTNKITSEWVDTGERVRLGESLEEAISALEKAGMLSWSDPGMNGRRRRYHRFIKENGEIKRERDWHSSDIERVTECKNVDYLYVTTYQNDNYRFVADTAGFDIHAKCKELDTYAV